MRLPLLAFALALSACTTANIGPGAEANQTQAIELDAAPTDAYALAMREAAGFGWTVKNSSDSALLFTAEAPGSIGRWDDEVTVSVDAAGSGSLVTVRSGLGQGPNRRHVADFIARLVPAAD